MDRGILPLNPSNIYASHDWFIAIKDNINDFVKKWFGKREVFLDEENVTDDEQLKDIRDTVDLWFISNDYRYSKLYETTQLEYNPLWNVDGTEVTERELKQTGTEDNKHTGNNKTVSKTTVDGTVTDGSTTYNDVTEYDTTQSKTDSTSGGDATTTYNSTQGTTKDLTDTEHITLTRQGNIGVTTTTKLLTEQRDFVNFNFLQLVCHDIANEISIGVF